MSAPRTRTARLPWHLLTWEKYTHTIIPDLFPPDIVPPGLPRIVLLLQVPQQVGASRVHGQASRALELDLLQKARRFPHARHVVCLTFSKKNPLTLSRTIRCTFFLSLFYVTVLCGKLLLSTIDVSDLLEEHESAFFWRLHFSSSSASVFPPHLFCDFQVKNSSLIAPPSPQSKLRTSRPCVAAVTTSPPFSLIPHSPSHHIPFTHPQSPP